MKLLCADEWCNVLSFLETKEIFSQCARVCREWNVVSRQRIPLRLNFGSLSSWSMFVEHSHRFDLGMVLSLEIHTILSDSIDEDWHKSDYSHIALMTHLEHLSIPHQSIKSRNIFAMPDLSGLEELNSLSMYHPPTGDHLLYAMPSNITQLDVTTNKKGETSLDWLAHFPRLVKFSINRANMSNGKEDAIERITHLRFSQSTLEKVREKILGLENLTHLELLACCTGYESIDDFSSLTNLTHLSVVSCFHHDGSRNYVNNLSGLIHLRYLDLRGNYMGEGVSKDLLASKTLTHLNLSDNQLSEDDLINLSELTKLTHLDLSVYRGVYSMRRKGFKHLTKLKRLTHLNLSQNMIQDYGPKYFSRLSRLVHLDLSCNHITHEGVPHLSKLTCLTHLDLSDNGINENVLSHLSPLINIVSLDLSTDPMRHLSSLRYGAPKKKRKKYENHDSRDKPLVESSLDHLSEMVDLCSLSLSDIEFTPIDTARLLIFTKLQSLDLSRCKMTTDIGCLGHLNSLTHLNLSCNPIGNEGISQLSRMTQLTSLNVGDCSLTNDCILDLNKLVRLVNLDLGRCEFGNSVILFELHQLEILKLDECQVVRGFVRCLSNLKSLKNLDLSRSAMDNETAIHLARMISDGKMPRLSMIRVFGALSSMHMILKFVSKLKRPIQVSYMDTWESRI